MDSKRVNDKWSGSFVTVKLQSQDCIRAQAALACIHAHPLVLEREENQSIFSGI